MSEPSRPSGATRASRSTPLYLGIFVLLGVAALLLGPSLDTFRAGAGVSSSTIGLLFTALAAGYLVGALLAGKLLQSIPAHRVFGVGMLIAAGSIAALGFVSQLAVLIVFEALVGFGTGAVDVTGNAVVLWLHKGGPVMNALHLCFGIGATLSPVIVNQSLQRADGLHAGYLLVAVLMTAAALFVFTRPSPANPHTDEQRGIPTGSGRAVALGVLFFLAYVGVEVGFIGWVFEFAVAHGFARNREANWLGTGFLAAFTVGRLISVPLARVVSPLQALMADTAVAAAGTLLLMVAGDAAPAIWVGTILIGLGMASMFPSMLSLSEPVVPSTSTVTSAYLFGASVGTMTLPAAMGWFLEKSGPRSLPLITLLGILVCGTIVVAFVGLGRRRLTPSHAA